MTVLTDPFARMSATEASLEQIARQIADLMVLPVPPALRDRIETALAAARLQIATLRQMQSQIVNDPALRLLPFADPRQERLRGLGQRLHLWEQVQIRIRGLVRNRQIPLLQGQGDAALVAHDLLWRRLHHWMNGKGGRVPTPPDGHYNDIPLDSTRFLRLMGLARRVVAALGKDHLAFLDVGCGNGMKLWQAADFVTRADGLEYTPALVALARELVGDFMPAPARVMLRDALEFDDYGRYDVIYFFKPMSNPEMLAQMERRIVAQASPGTVLIAPYPDFRIRADGLDVQRLAGDVYVTGQSAKGLKDLQKRAGLMGFADPFHMSEEERAGGFMAPLITALRRQGHSIRSS